MRGIVGAILVACVCGGLPEKLHAQRPSDLARLVDETIGKERPVPLPGCVQSSRGEWPGLAIDNGVVTKADLIEEIEGYAKVGDTTGGLGGVLRVVTTLRDYNPSKREPPIPGSLRFHLERAAADRMPAWIVFDRTLGPKARIELRNTLRIPSNVTIDGSCADITLEAPASSRTILAFIGSGVSNVIIARMAMHKTDDGAEENPNVDSCIRINGEVDRIAVLHNDLWDCGDGCIDITVSPRHPVPMLARMTVAFNEFRDHDKVMLFGTFDCASNGNASACDDAYLATRRSKPPSLRLTLQGNLFARTGQRHPRAFGDVSAHIFNNVIAFQPREHKDGRLGDSYGIFVSNGAKALVEDNFFIPLRQRLQRPRAVWTVNSPNAMKMPSDVEGYVRLGKNGMSGNANATEDNPSAVPEPGYSYRSLPLAGLSAEAALACVSDRAGRGGRSRWNDPRCVP